MTPNDIFHPFSHRLSSCRNVEWLLITHGTSWKCLKSRVSYGLFQKKYPAAFCYIELLWHLLLQKCKADISLFLRSDDLFVSVTSACMLLTAMLDICQIKKTKPQLNLEEVTFYYYFKIFLLQSTKYSGILQWWRSGQVQAANLWRMYVGIWTL